MTILYFLFAHLVADFVLQPNELIRWKFKSWHGVAVHSFIHLIICLLVFIPFMPDQKVFVAIFFVAAAHFIIDILKISTEKKGKHYLIYFFADQLLHLVTILLGVYLIGNIAPSFAGKGVWAVIYGNAFIALGLILLVIMTYTVEIIRFQFKRKKGKKVIFKPDYKSMLQRAVLFSLMYAIFMVFGVYTAAAFGMRL